ncbi:hypothetical protein BEL04_21770 [Mucilaginibacter sp. PPCGB 2223]|uniref:hypothetical protein n=1 Tax=Mucilaginibacter sp. PPCGB 2223 TaxID=1886027 RepID=UPI000824A7C2|nr:hypothetical protein [Mucilaginibacter sp. PPCGB 2223]OCX50414.1 hypothetical protein BEL04_21770 [Mucilaginibacter sp. PPCGB 2223]
MKKVNLLIITAVALVLTACHTGHHISIVRNTNGSYVKIECAGNIALTEDMTGIQGISPGGYVKYETNDEKIVAKPALDGHIEYELNDGDQQATLNEKGKKLIARAVKEIAKNSHY